MLLNVYILLSEALSLRRMQLTRNSKVICYFVTPTILNIVSQQVLQSLVNCSRLNSYFFKFYQVKWYLVTSNQSETNDKTTILQSRQ